MYDDCDDCLGCLAILLVSKNLIFDQRLMHECLCTFILLLQQQHFQEDTYAVYYTILNRYAAQTVYSHSQTLSSIIISVVLSMVMVHVCISWVLTRKQACVLHTCMAELSEAMPNDEKFCFKADYFFLEKFYVFSNSLDSFSPFQVILVLILHMQFVIGISIHS